MDSSREYFFSHEKLEVYQEAIAFIAWLTTVLESAGRVGDVRDQLDRASTSVSLNIAEGNGKYAPKDRCRFFDIAHGSSLECAAGLDVLVAKQEADRRSNTSWKGKLAAGRAHADGSHQGEFGSRIRTR